MNVDRDRGGAAVGADGEAHRHWVRGPGQVGALRLGVERVSQGARPLDQRLQPHAFEDPVEGERPAVVLALVLFEGAGRDGDGEGAYLERDRIGNGIDPGRGAAQGEVGLKLKAILLRVAVQVDLEPGLEGEERDGYRT